jgi:hypothetical protein
MGLISLVAMGVVCTPKDSWLDIRKGRYFPKRHCEASKKQVYKKKVPPWSVSPQTTR